MASRGADGRSARRDSSAPRLGTDPDAVWDWPIPPQPHRSGSWWGNLALWRGLAVAGFAIAFALGISLLAPRGERPFESVVVVLAGPDAKPALIATAERGSRFLTVKAVGEVAIARDRSLELWMLPDGRPPQSLGLVPASGVDRVALRAPAGVTLQNIPALAVSLEPAGGSTTGAPTGPVLYTGRVERTY